MHWMTPEAASISDLLEAPGPNLDAVVVSGSDETVRRVADRVRQLERGEPPARRVTVSGYGDRISLAVVPPADAWRIDDGAARSTHARQIARDIVMWHQAGCFSVQAVLVCGDDARQQAWADAIGREITDWEERWSADLDDERALAARADRQGLAEFRGTRRPKDGSGFGFAELVDGPVRRESLISSVPHVVPVHRTDGEPEQLVDAIDIQPRHLQGAAVVGWSAHADHAQDGHDEMARWVEAVRRVGATRICGSGELQRPSAGWLHDGALNVTTWGRWCTLE